MEMHYFTNEQKAALAFDKQSKIFDELYSANKIIQYKRERVRQHLLNYLSPSSNILELNSGTGEDAVYFATLGHRVHATDISHGMQEKLKRKIETSHLTQNVSTEICSFTELAMLKNKGPFDHIFSNFAGLNCTGELDKVLYSFDPLLKPGGVVTLVIMPKFCLWETLMIFKGKFKTAMRRLFSSKGTKARVKGSLFKCWYYSPSFVMKTLFPGYEPIALEGLCTIVPPSYIENFAERFPKTFAFLSAKENMVKSKWPWKNIGDYYIISLRKK